MASARDNDEDLNPNSNDLPPEGQQVMSSPNAAVARGVRDDIQGPVMNGVSEPVPRGPMEDWVVKVSRVKG